MDILAAVLVILVAIAILYEVSRRVGVPHPMAFVIGGLALAFVPGIPRIELEPELVLSVFLPPLLFAAAVEAPIRELRANVAPIVRLSFGLVLFTMVIVAVVAHLATGLDWAVAFTLGAIVAPTDPVATTTVFRRLGVPRVIVSLVEGETLFNDATALVAYRAAVAAVVGGGFMVAGTVAGFGIATVGGIVVGLVVGWLATELLRRIDDPPVVVVISLVIPFAAFVPAEELHLAGLLAAVTAGLMVGGRLGRILRPDSRVLWIAIWRMVAFVLDGFLFVLIGLELPSIVRDLEADSLMMAIGIALLVVVAVIVARLGWVYAASLLPGSPRRIAGRTDPRLARRLTLVVGWAGLRGAVPLALALGLPADFPERDLILFVTFTVILVTLLGQGLTLPAAVRWAGWDGTEPDGDEETFARDVQYQSGLDAIARARTTWPDHQPLLDRLEASLRDRSRHLATADLDETAERRQERIEHEAIQREVIAAQRVALIELRDRRAIDDRTLRKIEGELDLEEIRMEA